MWRFPWFLPARACGKPGNWLRGAGVARPLEEGVGPLRPGRQRGPGAVVHVAGRAGRTVALVTDRADCGVRPPPLGRVVRHGMVSVEADVARPRRVVSRIRERDALE